MFSHAYDENGNRSYMKLGNGVETEYTYNNANLIKSLKNKSGEKLLSSYGYTYYLDGNQESKTDNKGVKTTYVYDNQGRLTSERQTAQDKETNWAYEYDEAHNRSKMTVNRNGETEATDYTYDKNNRLLREISINAATGVKTLSSYAYDKNGNQLSKMSDVIALADISLDASLRIYILGDYSNNEDGESFNNQNKQGLLELNTYDVFNRLRTVRREGITAEYGYRADGLRILKTVNGETTTHVWDGSNMVAELDGSLDVKDIYTRGINLISSEENGYYVYNAHGDVVQLSDSTGCITKEYVYDAFGVEEDIDESDINPFRYCGEYADLETNTIYLRNRYYNPSNGRFIAEDPIKAGLNWYTYANNNPLLFVDPSGLDAIYMTFSDGAGGFGHSAIAFQDKDDKWWFMSFEGRDGSKTDIQVFFYQLTDIKWNKDNTMMLRANFLVPDGKGEFDIQDYYNSSKVATERFLFITTESEIQNDRKVSIYDSQVYINGDFSQSYDKALGYSQNAPSYFLTGQNCSWLALEVLQASATGDTYDKLENYLWHIELNRNAIWPTPLYRKVRNTIIPNNSVSQINKLFGQN